MSQKIAQIAHKLTPSDRKQILREGKTRVGKHTIKYDANGVFITHHIKR